ncbi:MAG: PepSY domain-containing protein [Evtepia sp.]|uniref:PepSY domain-containing protein n=1 Tax=Evtepia sp. TaxID=2773933 RepID=UPI002A74B643|nr:PepSY domain-containing protein [Evtepia sp.]MDY3015210.1 PepSY domain-containing protein [Evtepia sp.]
MTEHELNGKIQQAFAHAAPDALDEILSRCEDTNLCVLPETMPARKKPKKWRRWMAGLAAVLVLAVAGVVGMQTYQAVYGVASTVSLDVNPSIEIQVNQKDRVLDVKPLNEDGAKVVGDMDFQGSDLDVTVNALIGSMLRNGYLTELANSILVSVESGDPARSAALQEELSREIEAMLQTNTFSGAVLSQTVSKDKELQNLADTYDISLGKAQLIQQIVAQSPVHTFEELAPLSINELNLLSSQGNLDKVSAVGTASDKAYIGESKAREIALKEAGVSEGQITQYECELDYACGTMVYEVEFTSGGREYEYAVNALTGELVTTGWHHDWDWDWDHDDGHHGNGWQNGAGTDIGEAKAKEVALAHAGVSANGLRKYKCEREREDGSLVYEIEFISGGYEYSYEISAADGKILQWEKEWDD